MLTKDEYIQCNREISILLDQGAGGHYPRLVHLKNLAKEYEEGKTLIGTCGDCEFWQEHPCDKGYGDCYISQNHDTIGANITCERHDTAHHFGCIHWKEKEKP